MNVESDLAPVTDAMAAAMDLLRTPTGNARLVVAVSGGRDSMSMMHGAAQLRRPADIVHVVHVHHGIRGGEADDDAAFVRMWAARLGLECTVAAVDAPSVARRLHTSTQVAARRLRYAALRDAAAAMGGAVIATAHTADDNVETILHRIVRGSGITGLAGIPAATDRVIRPLIGVWRTGTEAYCRAAGIQYRDDSSNSALKYTRNRLRLNVLPEIRTHINPAVDRALLRLARSAQDASSFLTQCAERELPGIQSDDGLSLDLALLMALHPALRVACLQLWLGGIRGNTQDIDSGVYEWCQVSDPDPAGHSWTLPGGAILLRAGNRLLLSPVALPGSPRRVEYDIVGTAPTQVPEMQCRVWCSDEEVTDEMCLQVAICAITGRLRVRNRRPGDRLRARGVGTIKLQDLFVNRKVPAPQRDWVPVVCDDAGPLWVVGHGVDERALARCDEHPTVYVVCQWYTGSPGPNQAHARVL